jgi:hypothetical protein
MLEPVPLDQEHVGALDRAENLMYHCDLCPYLELKELFAAPTPPNQQRFRYLFTTYYGLNVGGLTEPFKDRYFEILFSRNVIIHGQSDFAGILTELSSIKSKRGLNPVPFSFVSKLVAMHQEHSPIYDRHVRSFLDFKEAKASSPELRIAWFIGTIGAIATRYQAWAEDERIQLILERLKTRDARLQHCHVVRLMDFLVWKVGNQKLLGGKTPALV